MNIRACTYFFLIFVAASTGAEEMPDFGRDIWPIIEFRCIECHGPEKQKEGLRFDDHEWLRDPELLGEGNATQSAIYDSVTLEKGEIGYMPKKRDPLTGDEKELLRRWLDADAPSEGWEFPVEIAIGVSGRGAAEAKWIEELGRGLKPVEPELLTELEVLGVFVAPLSLENALLRLDFDRSAKEIGDEHLALLEPIREYVTILGLANTSITDESLERLSKFPYLTNLHLGNTRVIDDGIAQLSTLKNLEVVNLVGTAVSDVGLAALAELPRLRKVHAWNSGVTAAGKEHAESVNPGLEVNIGVEPGQSVID